MRSYEAARGLYSFLGFMAWVVIVFGIVIAFVSAASVSAFTGSSGGLLAAAPGIGIALVGFMKLALVQLGRAGVDIAEYTQQMLKVARDQLEVSRQSQKNGNEHAGSFQNLNKRSQEKPSKTSFENNIKSEPSKQTVAKVEAQYKTIETIAYGGQEIIRKDHGYFVGAKHFPRLILAEQFIDNLSLKEEHAEITKSMAESQKLDPPQKQSRLDEKETLSSKKAPKASSSITTRSKNTKSISAPKKPNQQERAPKKSNVEKAENVPPDPKDLIVEKDGKILFGGLEFSSREGAEKYAEQHGSTLNAKP